MQLCMYNFNCYIQLKNFIQGASIDPRINDNYFVRAEEENQHFLDTLTARYILSFYIVGPVSAIIITAIVLVTHFYTQQWETNLKEVAAATTNVNKYTHSKIFSFALTTLFVNMHN